MAINIALRVWLPNDSPVRVAWLVPAIEGVLLAILLLGPATVPESRRWVRRVAVTFVVILVLAALWATVLLIYDLIRGEGVRRPRASCSPPAASSGSGTTSPSRSSTG